MVEELAAQLVLQLALDISFGFLVADAGRLYLRLGVLGVQGFVDFGVGAVGLLDAGLLVDEGVRYVLAGVLLRGAGFAEDLSVLVYDILEAAGILSLYCTVEGVAAVVSINFASISIVVV